MNTNALTSRYSVKKFDPSQKVSPEQVQLLAESFHLCPSSLNVQAWKLEIVENPLLKDQCAEAFLDTNPQRVRDCSHLLVFCRKEKIYGEHFNRVFDTTEIFRKFDNKVKSFIQLFALLGGKKWATNQVYLVFGFILAVCAENEIGSIPMEGFNHGKLDKILGLQGYRSVAVIAIGIPHESDKTNPSRLKKSRLPFEEIVSIR